MKKLVLGILSTLILTTNVLANEIETKKVISTGVGLTESEALKDTTRNAVQQVVGSYILSDTYVKNSQLIKDEILVNSNGFVKGFKIISQTKDSNGLIKIEAEVEVEPNNVTKRLGELNIVLKDVATTEFKAISLDKFQSVKDFKNIFDEIVLKPIKENKQIYDIKIDELKSVDKLPNYFSNYDNKDPSLMPFILSFSVDLKRDYINSIKTFLKKSSLKEYDSFTPSNFSRNNSVQFKIISNNKNNRDTDGLEYRNIYELPINFQNSYNNSVKLFFDNYTSNILINFNDSDNLLVKKFNIPFSYGYHLSSNDGVIKTIDVFNNAYLLGFDTYSNYAHDTLIFIENIKKVEFAIYLNEEEVSKIKSASVEIKWGKK